MQYKPDYILMENVEGYERSDMHRSMIDILEHHGYCTYYIYS